MPANRDDVPMGPLPGNRAGDGDATSGDEGMSPTTHELGSPERRRRRATGVLLAMIAIVIVGLLSPLPVYGRVSAAIGNLFHCPMFMAVTWLVLWCLNQWQPYLDIPPSRRTRTMIVRMASVAAIVIVSSIVMEGIQELGTRRASWHDVYANTLGVAGGCFIHAAGRVSEWTARLWPKLVAVAFAVLMTVMASTRNVAMLYDVYLAQSDYPLLASFETQAEITRWFPRHCSRKLSSYGVTHGNHSLRLRLMPKDFPGITLTDFYRDWKDFRSLKMDVAVDPELAPDEVEMSVKLIPGDYDRSDPSQSELLFKLRRGESHAIEISRDDFVRHTRGVPLDFARIRFLDLHFVDPVATTVVYLDNVRVE